MRRSKPTKRALPGDVRHESVLAAITLARLPAVRVMVPPVAFTGVRATLRLIPPPTVTRSLAPRSVPPFTVMAPATLKAPLIVVVPAAWAKSPPSPTVNVLPVPTASVPALLKVPPVVKFRPFWMVKLAVAAFVVVWLTGHVINVLILISPVGAVYAALKAFGITVEALHHEVAVGQHEIDFKYDEALVTADRAITMRMSS